MNPMIWQFVQECNRPIFIPKFLENPESFIPEKRFFKDFGQSCGPRTSARQIAEGPRELPQLQGIHGISVINSYRPDFYLPFHHDAYGYHYIRSIFGLAGAGRLHFIKHRGNCGPGVIGDAFQADFAFEISPGDALFWGDNFDREYAHGGPMGERISLAFRFVRS